MRGLPQLSASSVAKVSASPLDGVGELQAEGPERSAGVVRDQVWKAFVAALTASST